MDYQSGETDYQEGSNLVYHPTSDERTMAILAHILTFVAPVIATLVVYLLKKDESKYVSAQAKEALNFQITIMLVTIGLCLTLVGVLLLVFVGIWYFVLVIVATIEASENKLYRYPLTIRLIK
jgi:uncharacterized Tic20 family protein